VLLVSTACASDREDSEDDARRRECVALRDHVIDVRLADATNVDQAAHREVLRQALGTRFVDECTKTVDERQRHCALSATSADGIQACQH